MAKAEWVRVQFTTAPEREPYVYEPHRPVKMATLPWLVCQKCGLVYCRNALTVWCIQKGCNNSDHPEYRHVVKTLGR